MGRVELFEGNSGIISPGQPILDHVVQEDGRAFGLAADGGFYEGTVSGEVTFQGNHRADISGDVVVMLSGDGTAFIAIDACAVHGTTCTIIDEGGVIQVAEDGTISGELVDGTMFLGFLDLSEIETPT